MKKQLVLMVGASFLLGGCTAVNNLTQKVTQQAEDVAMEQAVKLECTKVDKDTCDLLTAQVKSFQRPQIMTSAYTSQDKETNGMTSEIKMDGKENMQIISSQNSKETSNMIIFNNATYVKDYADGKWMKMSSGEDDSLFNMKGAVEEIKETFKEENTKLVVKKLGEEACGNLTCTKYESYESDTPDEKTLVWVDTKEKLPRKMEMTYEDTTTVMTYAYESVTISEPSPVKEFTMPQLPEGAEGQMPSIDDIEQMMKDLPEMPTEE